MLFIHDTSTKALIDTGATHSFISCSFIGNLDFRPKPLVEILTVETPSRGLLEAHCVYKDCKINRNRNICESNAIRFCRI